MNGRNEKKRRILRRTFCLLLCLSLLLSQESLALAKDTGTSQKQADKTAVFNVTDKMLEQAAEIGRANTPGIMYVSLSGTEQMQAVRIRLKCKWIANNCRGEDPLQISLQTTIGHITLDEDVQKRLTAWSADDDVLEFFLAKVAMSRKQRALYGKNAEMWQLTCSVGGENFSGLWKGKEWISAWLAVEPTPGVSRRAAVIKEDGTLVEIWGHDPDYTKEISSSRNAYSLTTDTFGTIVLLDAAQSFRAVQNRAGAINRAEQTVIKAKAVGKRGAIQVSWKKPEISVDGYQVYASSKKNGKWKKIKTTSARSFRQTGLTAGSRRYYKVRGYKSVGDVKCYTKWSAKVTAAAR